MPQSRRAILFDFGDTLVHFGHVDRAALFREGARRTYRLWARRHRRMPDFQRYYLHQWFAIHWGLVKLALAGGRREVDTMRLLRRACRKLWLSAPEPFYRELAWHWYTPLAERAAVEPGTHELLGELRSAGYKLGLVSNTFVPGFVLDRHLDQLGLLPYLSCRVYSHDVGYRKPDRRIFHRALSAMGVSAERAVFVGDLVEADVLGAKRAGLASVWKRPPGQRGVSLAAAPVIDRLTELRAVLGGV